MVSLNRLAFGVFFLLVWGLLVLGKGELNAQGGSCPAAFPTDTILNISCGDSTLLQPFVNDTLVGDDFNDQNLDAGWDTSQTVSYYDSLDCLEDPVNDGSPFLWMGPTATQPRNLSTKKFNVACGGQICFDLIMGSENMSGDPCEGPDQQDEGVHFQYSIDGGTTWKEIFYFNPDTACCGCGGGCGGQPSSPFVGWDNYCFQIPSGAYTDTTKFRWWQEAGSGQDYDHWGLDNVTIVGGGCNDSLIYSYDSTNFSPNGDTVVTPYQDTTYNLTIVDTLKSPPDTCTTDISLEVDTPDPQAEAIDSLICDNDSTVLHADDSCTYTLDMFDQFGGSWSGAQVEVYINGTLIGAFSVTSGGSATEQFQVAYGDSLSIEYVSGFSDDENTYVLYDGNGNIVFQDGPSPTIGVAYVDSSTSACGFNFDHPNYSLTWSPDSSLSSDTADAPFAFPDTNTSYVITYANSNQPKCDLKDTVPVAVQPWGGNTSISYSSGSYCYDASDQAVTINGVKGGTFYSTPPGLDLDSSTGLIDVQNSVADSSYMVYYKTPGTKCSFTDSVPITIDSITEADFHYADTSYCETASSVSPTFLNNGSHGVFTVNDTGLALDSNFGTVDVQASDTGSYWVQNTIISSGSCPSDTEKAQIIIEEKPLVDAGADDTICEGDTYTLDGSYSGASSKSTWITLGDGTFDDKTDTNATYTPGNADKNSGDVRLIIESDSIKACNVDRDTMELVIQPAPSLTLSSEDTICANSSSDVTANISGTATGVEWGTMGDGFFDDPLSTSTVYHPGSNDKNNGSVKLYATTQGTGFCQKVSDTMELVVHPMADPTFEYPGSNYCVSADSTIVPNIQGDTGGVFTADPPGGLAIDSSTGEIDISGSYADYYDVTYTVGERCPADTTVQLRMVPQPSLPDPNPFSVCQNRTDTLRVTSQVDSVVWYGSPDADNAVDMDASYSPDASQHQDPGQQPYYVRTYKDGCPSELASVNVTVHDSANVVVNTSPDPARGVKPFDVNFTNASGDHVVDYTLEFGKGMSVDRFTWSDTLVTYEEKGEYQVKVSAYDSSTGCLGNTELLVDVTSEPKAKLPNVFTPNGDGRNEVFAPKMNVPCPEEDNGKGTCWNGIANFKGTIFNRWGNAVYKWSNWNDAWTGENASAGTYYYVIEATGENGAKKTYKGQVTLMRDGK